MHRFSQRIKITKHMYPVLESTSYILHDFILKWFQTCRKVAKNSVKNSIPFTQFFLFYCICFNILSLFLSPSLLFFLFCIIFSPKHFTVYYNHSIVTKMTTLTLLQCYYLIYRLYSHYSYCPIIPYNNITVYILKYLES